MRIDEALAESKTLAVKFGSAVLNIEYRPPSFTLEEMEKVDEDKRNPERIIDMVQELVLAWDLTRTVLNEHNEPVFDGLGNVVEVPVDVTNRSDVKKYVRINVINGIIRAIKEDNSPGEA